MDQKPMNSGSLSGKEKNCTLQSLISKINKTEPSTFGNYYVNFNEMFQNLCQILRPKIAEYPVLSQCTRII